MPFLVDINIIVLRRAARDAPRVPKVFPRCNSLFSSVPTAQQEKDLGRYPRWPIPISNFFPASFCRYQLLGGRFRYHGGVYRSPKSGFAAPGHILPTVKPAAGIFLPFLVIKIDAWDDTTIPKMWLKLSSERRATTRVVPPPRKISGGENTTLVIKCSRNYYISCPPG